MGGKESKDIGSGDRGWPISYPSSSYSTQTPVRNPARGHTGGDDGSRIDDNYGTLDEISNALARAGLESSNLIIGIDFTKSNEWTGKISFKHRSLHHFGHTQNPYEQAIYIIGKTLSSFDEDNLIPCFGFGDASTHDQDVFSFYPNQQPCRGFEDVLSRYRKLVPHVRLSGPTSFAPIIEMAMTIIEESGGQYHVLVIIADGQVTGSMDMIPGQCSPQEQKTYKAIVEASYYPLSIILVGVGDGPWDTMMEFDNNIPSRAFDNFQFVNFTSIMLKNIPKMKKEREFALSALMDVPTQYKATIEHGLLGQRRGISPERVPLPPPSAVDPSPDTAPSSLSTISEIRVCPICLVEPKDMAFGCGHQTCQGCGQLVENCPMCRSPIDTRIRLY